MGRGGRLCMIVSRCCCMIWQGKSVPVEVEGPEGDDGKHLDLPELDRRPTQDVVYHDDCLQSSCPSVWFAFGPPRCGLYSVVAFRRHECSAVPQLFFTLETRLDCHKSTHLVKIRASWGNMRVDKTPSQPWSSIVNYPRQARRISPIRAVVGLMHACDNGERAPACHVRPHVKAL